MSTQKAEEHSQPAVSEPHSSTPTLTPQPETTGAVTVDQEKQLPGPPTIPGAPFPDGGLRAWAAVAGAWLFGKSAFYAYALVIKS
jgi:hypothetical protein